MDIKPSSSRIDGLGDWSLRTHFCLFYETKQELFEMLALHFNAGLAKNEFCLWITPEAFEKARNILRQAIPSADQDLEAGRIEIFSSQQWYFTDDAFDAARAIRGIETKLAQALEKRYTRMRVMADQAWSSREYWKAFSDYEGQLDEQFANEPIRILCAYPTRAHRVADVLDVVRTHRSIAAKRNGNWEILEAPELKHAGAEAERFDAKLDEWIVAPKHADPLRRREAPVIVRYGVAILSVIAATLLQDRMYAVFHDTPQHVAVFLCAVMFSAWFGGFGPGFFAIVLSFLAFYRLPASLDAIDVEFPTVSRLVAFGVISSFVLWVTATQRQATESLRQARDGLKRNNQLLQRSNIELNRAYNSTLEGWSRALDLRDRETEGHSQRVAEITLRLATAISVEEPDLVHIRRGALLHDIGKLGIPDSILLKPGPLSEEERNTIQRHPTVAFELLAPIAYLRPALDIPYCHHERWDGSGYPRGLKGEQIPLAARIFAVVDVWDALVSDRPYRKAWPTEKARIYLQEQAGHHFDPGIVDTFLFLLDQGKIMRNNAGRNG